MITGSLYGRQREISIQHLTSMDEGLLLAPLGRKRVPPHLSLGHIYPYGLLLLDLLFSQGHRKLHHRAMSSKVYDLQSIFEGNMAVRFVSRDNISNHFNILIIHELTFRC